MIPRKTSVADRFVVLADFNNEAVLDSNSRSGGPTPTARLRTL